MLFCAIELTKIVSLQQEGSLTGRLSQGLDEEILVSRSSCTRKENDIFFSGSF
jgi:hypothetical protein